MENSSADLPRVTLPTRVRRAVLEGVLSLYDLVLYLVNDMGWLLLTPLISLFLFALGGLGRLASIPALRSSLLKPVATMTDQLIFYWIAPLWLYMQGGTAAATVRGKFQREASYFLNDVRCDRIVVIAHSWGTVAIVP